MENASETWKDAFPYETAYCDHFETPQRAYEDVVPVLDEIMQECDRSKVTVYDPYYCDGRAGKLLRQFGFRVKHEKRDFYDDVKNSKVPHHDILVTNPPFSDQHKKVSS